MRALGLWVALVLIVLVAGPSTAPSQTPSGELAFTLRLRGDHANGAVCVARSTELRRARRMTGLGEFTTAAWSRDGRRIAVGGGERAEGRIRVANAAGSGWRGITRPRPTEQDSAPAWSPDGRTIAFSRDVFFGPGTDYGRAGVWTVDLATRQERQISRTGAAALAWSPRGDLIAGEPGGVLNTDVLLLREDGRLERTIRSPDSGAFEDGVSWSPDGARLALGGGIMVDRTGREVGRFAARAGGYVVRSPSWSPDGATIAYERARSWTDARTNVPVLGYGDLYLAPAAGGRAVRLTATSGISEGNPVWRPRPSSRAGSAQACIVAGTSGRDLIRGTALDDLVDAGEGNDLVYGLGGDDFLVGGPGADGLTGGGGNDDLRGEAGSDRLYARDGTSDAVSGGPGRDRARVDPGRDRATGVESVYPRR